MATIEEAMKKTDEILRLGSEDIDNGLLEGMTEEGIRKVLAGRNIDFDDVMEVCNAVARSSIIGAASSALNLRVVIAGVAFQAILCGYTLKEMELEEAKALNGN